MIAYRNIQPKSSWILVDAIIAIMISEICVESAKLHPSGAHFWRGVSKKSARVCSNVRKSKNVILKHAD